MVMKTVVSMKISTAIEIMEVTGEKTVSPGISEAYVMNSIGMTVPVKFTNFDITPFKMLYENVKS